MGLFGRVSGYLWSYVSSSDAQKQRSKPAALRDNSQAKGTQQWRAKRKASLSSDSLADGGSPSPKKIKLEFEPSDLDDILSDSASDAHSIASPSADFDVSDTTVVMDDMEYAKNNLEHTPEFDPEADRLAREQHADELRSQGWSECAVLLNSKLDARGKEPMLPKTWMLDFPTVPEALFSASDDEVIVSSASGKDFRGTDSRCTLLI